MGDLFLNTVYKTFCVCLHFSCKTLAYLLIWNDYWWAIFSCHFKWFILSNRLCSLLASYLTEVATSPSSKLECLTSGMSIYILMKFQVSSNFDFLTRICSLILYKAFCVSLHFLCKTLPIYWYKMIIGGPFFLTKHVIDLMDF